LVVLEKREGIRRRTRRKEKGEDNERKKEDVEQPSPGSHSPSWNRTKLQESLEDKSKYSIASPKFRIIERAEICG
jgi:hypothetical protein